MNSKFIDFTDNAFREVGLLKESISFKRSANLVSNAFLNGLIKSGLSLEQAYNVYLSSAYRHKLDFDLEDKLEKAAFKAGREVGEEYKNLSVKNSGDYGWINDKIKPDLFVELVKRKEWKEVGSG